jgi:hypothetical protein
VEKLPGKRLIIEFQDNADMNRFLSYAAQAKEQDGTVTGLYAGVMCSTIRDSSIKHDGKIIMKPRNEKVELLPLMRCQEGTIVNVPGEGKGRVMLREHNEVSVLIEGNIRLFKGSKKAHIVKD